ncbi:MAG: hypothetical protein ABI910_23090 [Gemmatimonadota bacterium]
MTESREKMVRDTLASDRAEGFAPGFADRAVARWREDRDDALALMMQRHFRRLAPVAVAASLMFVLLSESARDAASNQSVSQALLGWRSTVTSTQQLATLESIYGLDATSLVR